MQFLKCRLFSYSVAACLVAALTPALAQAPAGYTSLFNGDDLTGWTGDERLWRVENGAIVGSTHGVKLERNSFLSTEKSFDDFSLLVQVKLINHNSGIQFRSEQHPDHVVKGYQADVAEQTYFGMLYEEGKRGIMPYWKAMPEAERTRIQEEVVHQGGWNAYEIVCRGDRVQMILNGETTCDIVDPEGAKEGIVALQLHAGPEMEVYFKDIFIKPLAEEEEALLMPDIDRTRSERLSLVEGRFQTPAGFTVEEVATNEQVGSVINLAFDHLGRPVLAAQEAGLFILEDEDGDGKFEKKIVLTEAVSTAMGINYLDDGDLLVQANSIAGPGLYRLTDTDLNDEVDVLRLLQKSDGGMGEHGPHAIEHGADGFLYILYGNHARPKRAVDPASPLRDAQEDHLLPRYVDPRGHANHVRAPGGTIHRVDPRRMKTSWQQVVGGFRNPYDFSINAQGEMLVFDSDMEWDLGLPWFRPVRALHAIPGADYGWRTGSSKIPTYQIDTLPSIDDIGRGSPVGTAFYEHHVYPARFRGAYIMGDWSRGRIRIIFPKEDGATYRGKTMDFVLGEPLNVTDLDVGPDGFVYFTTGGRGTVGGLYRIRYTGEPDQPAPATEGIMKALDQDMPRSAWGRRAIRGVKEALGDAWGPALREAASDETLSDIRRIRALEALMVHGPRPGAPFLKGLAQDAHPNVRAMAVYLLGAHPRIKDLNLFIPALADDHPLVVRRAAEALVRRGLSHETPEAVAQPVADALIAALGNSDQFARYAVREALDRTPVTAWRDTVLAMDPQANAIPFLEGVLAAIYAANTPEDSNAVFAALQGVDVAALSNEALLDYLRVVSLAYIRDQVEDADRSALAQAAGPALLKRFPHESHALNRELQVVLAHFETPGTIAALLDYLKPGLSQEDQIHTVYCLRTIESGWARDQRDQVVAWFDRGREMSGAASMEGYINNLWDAVVTTLPEEEKQLAEARKAKAIEERRQAALALMADLEESRDKNASMELAQMSFEELSDYLEYDPMAYRPGGLDNGKKVFLRTKCADCHVFADIGRGGGPDLSTVASRFRRRDLLEAIMYPSKVISDQYESVYVELDDFTDVRGMVAGENDNTLTLITVTGDRVEIDKETIVSREKSDMSVMPEGLLNTMSLGELVDLIKYLESGGLSD